MCARPFTYVILLLICANSLFSQKVIIKNKNSSLRFGSALRTSIKNDNHKNQINNNAESEYLLLSGGKKLDQYKYLFHKVLKDEKGNTTYEIIGKNAFNIEKIIIVRIYNDIPDFYSFTVKYINKGKEFFDVSSWVNHHYEIKNNGDKPSFYLFQGSSTSERNDWIQPIDISFSNQNYMGMNSSDYGGGIPMVDLWRKDQGIAIGHSEAVPKNVSLPVQKLRDNNYAEIKIEQEVNKTFKPKDTIFTLETFVIAHIGDCFTPLRYYSKFMQTYKEMEVLPSEPSAFEPMWCAWGYEREFTLEEIIGTLPKVKELGIKWVTIDDGYQITEGDWNLNKNKFPNGNSEMRNLTDAIHKLGLKAQLWYAPLALSFDSKYYNQNPDVLIRDQYTAPQFITWWDAWYMSPTDDKVWNHTADNLKMFLQDWNFDGLKLDGQHLNGVAPDHAQGHEIYNPDESNEKLPLFFKHILAESKKYKSNALIQHCPCGTCMSFHNMFTTNQFVASDPISSKQIRQKRKVYAALMPNTAYFGDHVELSDEGNDFASTFGVGGVLGTKFTYPKDNPLVKPGYLLTQEKEVKWKMWFDLYNKMMLSKGSYLGASYDIGYDKPEAHFISKDGKMYYSFYAEDWQGDLHFKNLMPNKKYIVKDYISNKILGTLDGNKPFLFAIFKKYLLVVVE